MNFSNHTLAYEDLRDCTLITKNGTKIPVTIDYIETTADTFPKFEGHITGTAKVFYCNILNSTYGIGSSRIPEIKNVIFNDPATIVFWEDGTKTVVKCQDGDEFDPEKGLAMAIVKKAYGNKGSYCNKLKKWLAKEEPVDSNDILSRIFETKVFPINPNRNEFLTSFKKGIGDALDVIFKVTRCTSDNNSVSSKKRMTFREEVAKLHPENVDPIYDGGVLGCPRDIKKCPYLGTCKRNCRACWDREIPDELMDND